MAALAKTSPVPTGPHLDNRRIAAALIDLLVPLAGVAAALAAGLSLTGGLLLVGVGWTLYYFFALESGDGQTLGKRAMKLRVVSADGTPASMEQIAKRTVVRIVDGHIVGLIVMLATGERRLRLGDIVAGTVVTEAQTASSASAVPAAGQPALKRATPKTPFFKRQLSLPSFGKPKPKPVVASPAAPVPAAPAPTAPAPAPSAKKPSLPKRDLSLASLRRSKKPKPAAVSPAAAAPAPADAVPSAKKESRLKRELSLPSFGRSKKPKVAKVAKAPRAKKAPKRARTPKPVAAPKVDKPSLLKRELSLPSFGRKARRRVPDSAGLAQTAGPGPVAAPAPSGPAPAPEGYGPAELAQSDRLSEALRAAASPEVTPFDPFQQPDAVHPEPSVELERDESDAVRPEPSVDFERDEPDAVRPEPSVDFERDEPDVELDGPEAWDTADEPDPLADLGGGEPVVEMDEPELEPEPEPELEAEPELEPEPAAPSEEDAEMTIKPIETVSAIDLVMLDAEERRPADD